MCFDVDSYFVLLRVVVFFTYRNISILHANHTKLTTQMQIQGTIFLDNYFGTQRTIEQPIYRQWLINIQSNVS